MRVTPDIAVQGSKPVDKQDARLKKACQDFEAVLMSQMLSAMRQTVTKSDLFGNREKEEMFTSMLDQEMTTQMSRTGAMGIADMLYSQLSRINKNQFDTGQSADSTAASGLREKF